MPVMRTNSMTFDASVPVLVVGGGGNGHDGGTGGG